MDSTSLPIHLPELPSSQRERLFKEGALVSISEIFATIPDPRRRQGLRYELAYLLTCLVAALLCGRNSTLAVAEWCRDEQPLLEEVFGPRTFYCPDDSLYRKLLPRLDVCQVEGALADWIRMTLSAEPDDPIALDGKTVRGAGSDDHEAPHLLSFRTHYSQETLLQIEVEEKTNEIPMALMFLPALPVAGRVLTADALHTHVPFFLRVQQLEGDVVLVVKDNQPTLHDHLATYFADPLACFEEAETIDEARADAKKFVTSRSLLPFRTTSSETGLVWGRLAQLTRTVTTKKTGKTTVEVVYLITTLSREQASPQRFLELVRGHWSIENSSHYVRDVTFLEDRSRLRTGNAPQILAALRNLVITLIHRHGSSQIASTRRSLSSHPERAFAWLHASQAA